jgi:GNAT superfamily N-acetyltransferase
MGARDIPSLQRFLEENPDYSLLVEGEPPGPDAAQKEFDALPPRDWPMKRKWVIGFRDEEDELIGIADLIEDLFIAHVWHLGLFVIATRLHGRGVGRALYESLEGWVKSRGCDWIRLGVVVGNARAERFWPQCGYREVRMRLGVPYGKSVNDIRVMVKPLAGGSMKEYLAAVARDRPE